MRFIYFGASFLLLVMHCDSSEDTEIFSLFTEIISRTCEASLSAKNKEINDLKRSKAACEARIDGGEMKGQIQIFI